MAQELPQQFPIDQENDVAIGFGFPFSGEGVFIPTYFTKDQIKADLLNFILTNEGERYMEPFFGLNLRSRIFEFINNDNFETLDFFIKEGIANQFNNIEITELNIRAIEDKNEIYISMKYDIIGFGEDELSIAIT